MPAAALPRRRFLKNIALGARRTNAGKQSPTLVCVFLRGGADTLNILVPHGNDAYYKYRPTLAIDAPGKGDGSALPIDDFYGLHPRMAPLMPLYSSGRLAFVQGVGTDNPTGSHFEAQDQIEHGTGYGHQAGGGWLGRHLRTHVGDDPGPLSAVAIGETLPESLRGAPAASALRSLDDLQIKMPRGDVDAVTKSLARIYGAQADLLGRKGTETLALLERVRNLRAKEYVPEPGAKYGDDRFATGLREIARLIKADVGLEVACIDLDGWDTHFVQKTLFGGQVGRLADGLAAFDADIAPVRERVTVLVLTEFGRRIYENASFGTDHGRGFTAMAFGAGVVGGTVHGGQCNILEDAQTEGPDGLEIAIDYRSVLSEVLSKQIGNHKMDQVFQGFTPRPVGLIA